MPKGGAREGAGRKSAKDERLIVDVVNSCWERIAKNLKSNRLTEEQKDLIALEVVKRTAPKNIDLTTKGKELPSPIYGGHSTTQLSGHESNSEDISTEEED